jgi:penicillin-binding protein 2
MKNLRRHIIQFIFVLVGSVFIVRLFILQVWDSNYKLKAQDNVMRRITVYPYRGLIFDREGKHLVYNTPVFDLMVITREMEIKDTATFCRQFNITKKEFLSALKKAKEQKEYSSVKPIALFKQLSIADFGRIQDFLVDYKGFYAQARTIRSYPHQNMANALGYIGEVSRKQLENQEDHYYQQGDYIGISGMESSYENFLRGKRGARYVMVNVRGVEKGRYKEGVYDTLSIAGDNLYCTVDLELQQYGEKLMANKKGSVVAIDPSTGEILTIISSPSYDPNLLTGRNFPKNFLALGKDSLVPLFNRPLMAMYPPGSIFKLVQAGIAQQLGLISSGTLLPCNKDLVNCHPHASPQDLKGSIQFSCNPYYYQVFKKIIEQNKSTNKFEDSEIGFNEWYSQVQSFGLGKKLGVDLPNEKPGIIPSNAYFDKVYGDLRWKFSTIYSLGIGQGEMGVIPIQMANLAAIMANRGYYYIPHLVQGIGAQKRKPKKYLEKHYTSVDAKYFEPIVQGMEQVMLAGTAASSQVKGIAMCGKTGTAQNPHGEDHSVFIAFAPKDNPKIAIAVFVENAGFGGVWAAPIASLMIDKYLNDSISNPAMEKRILEKDFIGHKKTATP